MISAGRYTSGRIAVANLSALIEGLELRRAGRATFDNLMALSELLFVRGDLLGRIADQDRAELVAIEAIALSPSAASALFTRAKLAERFHRFEEANAFLDRALAAGYPRQKIDAEKAALLHATGQYSEALVLRQRLAKDDPGIHSLGALASLLADVGAAPSQHALGWPFEAIDICKLAPPFDHLSPRCTVDCRAPFNCLAISRT
jgi:tetratricopeptide (TPR) repeat protein